MYVQLRQFADQHRIRTHTANYSALANKSRLERAGNREKTAKLVQSVVMLNTVAPPSPPCPIDVDADVVVVPNVPVEVFPSDGDEEYEIIDQVSSCEEKML